MEHRWTTRVPVALDVMLYQRGIPVAVCRSQEISAQGISLREGARRFQRNTFLEIEFALREKGELCRYRIPAVVMHSSEQSTGLMFDTKQPDVVAAIRRLMHEETRSAQPAQAVSGR